MWERIHHRQPSRVCDQGMLKDEVEQSGCPSLSNNDQIFPEFTSFTRSMRSKGGHLRSKGDLEITNLVGDLHKESRNKSFSNIWIVLFGSEFSTSPWQSKSVHDTWQLLSDIISTEFYFIGGAAIELLEIHKQPNSPHQWPVVDEVFITPLWWITWLFECMINVE